MEFTSDCYLDSKEFDNVGKYEKIIQYFIAKFSINPLDESEKQFALKEWISKVQEKNVGISFRNISINILKTICKNRITKAYQIVYEKETELANIKFEK